MSALDLLKQIEKELNVKLKKLKRIESLLRLSKIGLDYETKTTPNPI